MQNRPVVVIDLGEYEMTGEIEMGEPSLRNLTMRDNALGNCTRTHMENGTPVIDETRIGDADIINTLVYVRKAPFNNTVKSFLEYCDRMPPGQDIALYEKMKEVGKLISEDKLSPFAVSQEVETESSD